MVYARCLPAVQETCAITTDGTTVGNAGGGGHCEEGCVCPAGTVFNDGTCVTRAKCPCKLRNTFYQPGDEITKDCNKWSVTIGIFFWGGWLEGMSLRGTFIEPNGILFSLSSSTCVGGEWSCTNAKCRAECYAIGDPHYKTFDGMKYDFMGSCSYYLVVLPEFSVETENVPCDGTTSLERGYGVTGGAAKQSCTKTVTIRFGNGTAIRLGQGKRVSVNGAVVDKLPVNVQGVAYVREQSTFFVQVVVTNGVEVWWDGETRAYVYVGPELEGKPKVRANGEGEGRTGVVRNILVVVSRRACAARTTGTKTTTC